MCVCVCVCVCIIPPKNMELGNLKIVNSVFLLITKHSGFIKNFLNKLDKIISINNIIFKTCKVK